MCSSPAALSSPSSAFASSSSSFSAAARSSPAFDFRGHQRPASSTRVHLAGVSSPSSASTSFRFSIVDRLTSPTQPLSVSSRNHQIGKKPADAPPTSQRRTCMCSPTTHQGSFRCSLHKNLRHHPSESSSVSSPSSRLNARRSVMTNSLVRIGSVEGSDVIKRALAALIRPSSQQQRRRASFQPRPSRLSVMSKAEDLC
ncbi:unnamed protein product [Spirodela intermedia]|uniref:Uncharacterized protein n=1 Tax=Spirodela intermedia TaxID=51605 RepID=A0A7I8LBD3_SPIIN|nr:unnamed protein product [Spirodela intermedia]